MSQSSERRGDLVALSAKLTREALEVAGTVEEITTHVVDPSSLWLLNGASVILRHQLEWLETILLEAETIGIYRRPGDRRTA